jgi:hypothetical protein
LDGSIQSWESGDKSSGVVATKRIETVTSLRRKLSLALASFGCDAQLDQAVANAITVAVRHGGAAKVNVRVLFPS